MLKKILIGFAVLFGLVVMIGIFADPPAENSGSSVSEATDEEPAEAALIVTAAEISKTFQENEAKAQLAYGDKILEVTGLVKDITLDFSDNPVINLKGSGDQFDTGFTNDGKLTDVTINGLPNDVAANINKGETHTFICSSIAEALGSAGLSDCKLK